MDIEVEFRSDAFAPFLPEDSQVNPERYGAELAWWLCRQLADEEVYTSYPNFEDWGWFLEYINERDEYWLCCGNVDGEKNKWRLILQPQAKKLFGRGKPPIKDAIKLLDALKNILDESAQITAVIWDQD